MQSLDPEAGGDSFDVAANKAAAGVDLLAPGRNVDGGLMDSATEAQLDAAAAAAGRIAAPPPLNMWMLLEKLMSLLLRENVLAVDKA